jgi:hypothetical protein
MSLSKFQSFESVNYPDFFMAHRSFLGVIIEVPTEPDKKNSTFQIVQGLAARDNPQAVSIESVNYPGYYFVHSDFRLHLKTSDGTPEFMDNATYWMEPGNEDPTLPGLRSFRSYNYPSRFISHSNLELGIHYGDGDQFKKNSTFKVDPPNWPPP